MKLKALLSLVMLVLPQTAMIEASATPNSPKSSASHRAARVPSLRVSENSFDLSAFGAIGDGVADDGPALQSALDSIANAGGGTLFVPAGRYAIYTPVQKNFTGLAASVTIQGVESSTPVAPPTAAGAELTRGLDLISEFAPRTGEFQNAIVIAGLETLLIKDIVFIGTPDVENDALITLALNDISEATIRHCEFYGLSSLVEGGAIVQAVRSSLTFEQSIVLGSTCSSGVYSSVIQNLEWKGITISDAIFADYGQRDELYGKMQDAPFSWVSIGNAAAPENDSPRRQVVVRSVFLDEGGFVGISSLPNDRDLPSAPIDLLYITGLYMNVSNFGTTGHYLDSLQRVFIEKSHYGWSHNADSAIYLLNVGNAIIDEAECVDNASRIRADAQTGKLTVINSVYTYLDSEAQTTDVITTTTPEEDPVQYVRQQFMVSLGRVPDAAAHFYWSDQILQCGADSQCVAGKRAALAAYLGSTPSPTFTISGRVTDETGASLSGAAITLSGAQSATTATDSAGQYRFSNLPTSGSYTVSVAKPPYDFNPPDQTFTTPASDQTGDFAFPLDHHAISGYVTDTDGNAVAGVTVGLSGTQSRTTTTNASGDFSFVNLPAGGNYTVRPSLQDHSFAPESRTYTNLASNQDGSFVAILNTPTISVMEFSAANYGAPEGAGTTLTVERAGDTSAEATVIYSAADGSAHQGKDLNSVIGQLNFAPGETSQTFTVFITDDAFVEGDEQLTVTLSDPDGATLGTRASATLTIDDNDSSVATPNPADDAQFFVRQHYRDFLNREPDAGGLAFWSSQILACETEAACVEDRRINVSAAFFLSIEFQETGFLVHRFYKASFAQPPKHRDEFLLDTRTIAQGVVVNAPGWQQQLENNKTAFVNKFVERPSFRNQYPLSLTPMEFVNLLNAKAGGPLTTNSLAAAVAEFQGSTTSAETAARARVLRRIAESETFSQREFSPAFVLMQYFGYLQRNPSDQPDSNLDGYDFWLSKLYEFGGDFRHAQMVKSFLVSGEYRSRFGL